MTYQREPELERSLAVDLFNHTWTLLDKTDRSIDEIDEMISASHASLFHWMKCGTALNRVRGHWQVARVHAVVGQGAQALHHGQRCLDLAREHGIGDFDLAFAHEAIARAAVVAGDHARSAEHLRLAREAGEAIAEVDDRAYFFEQLATIPGGPSVL